MCLSQEQPQKKEEESSLVKGPRPSSILPLSCFALLEGGGWRRDEREVDHKETRGEELEID